MADTPLLGITYPNESQDPYWTTIRSLFLSQDEWLQCNLEDKSLMIFGGGVMTLIGSTFSWSAPLYIVSQRSVTKITISASSVSVADGEVLYVTTGGRPITNQTLVLQAGSPTTKNDIPIGCRDGATVYIKDMTYISSYTLDDAYNASSGAADVSIDGGDVTWDTVGAYSFNVDLSLTTGAADGFFIIDGTDYLRLVHKTTNALDLESELRNIDFNSSGTIDLDATGTLRVDSDGATIIHGANVTVEADGGILAITGDGTADIDISNAGAAIDIDSTTLDLDTTGGIAIDSSAAGISLDGVTASNFTVSGATSDLTLGARAATITLNEAGQTTLSGGFAATSIIGAINESAAAILATTLDVAYNNDAGAAAIAVDAGDVTWATTGAYSFIVDITGATGAVDGFFVENGTDYTRLTKVAANQLDLTSEFGSVDFNSSGTFDIDSVGNVEINSDGTAILHGAGVTVISDGGTLNITGDGTADINFSNVGGEIDIDADILTIDTTAGITMDATQDISLDATWASNFSVTGASLTISTITSGELDLTSADLMDINAGANLDIDVTGATTIDSTTNISLDAATASNFTVSGAAEDLTLGARSTTITLNELGQTSLVGFTATSIIGALNESAVAIAGTTLDVAYNNFGATPAAVAIDNAEGQGSLTWYLWTGNDFVIDVSNASNPTTNGVTDPNGCFQIDCGTQFLKIGRFADNKLMLYGSMHYVDWNISYNMDIDVAGTASLVAVGTLELGGSNASLTTAGALAIASDFTLTGGGNILGGNVGIGAITAGYKFAIGSADNSNQIGIYHDNTNAYFTTDDGYFIFQTDEGTNTNSYLDVKGKGTGIGYVRAYDEDDAEYLELACSSGQGFLRTVGAAPSTLSIQNAAHADVLFFENAASAETQELKIYGYRAADSLRSLEIGVGVDAADTASFDGVSNYWFDGTVQVATNLELTAGGSITTTAAGDLTLAPDTTGTIICSNDVDVNGDLLQTVAATVTSATYTVLTGDATVFINYAGAVTITVPSALIAKTGWTCLFKDISLNASVHNISIVTAGAEEIEGETDALIDVDGAVLELRSDGTDLWDITRR